jgi:hypothetical protein
VEGQFAQMGVGVDAIQLFDGLGDPLVQPPTASRSQPLVQRVIDQRVGELESSDHLGGLTQK